jgi:hypothetical protein
MIIIISEQQLQRIIREFYEKAYNLGDYDVTEKIEKEIIDYNRKFVKLSVDERADKIGEYKDFMNETILNNFMDYYKGFFDREMNKIVRNNFLEQKSLNIYLIDDNDWKGVYYWMHGGLDTDKLNYVINHIKNKLDKHIEPSIKSKIETNPYSLSPKHSYKNIEDELAQKIYDWGYTKTILEKLCHKFLLSDKIDDELFDKFKGDKYIDEIIDKMDEVMEKNNYEIFHTIKETNLKNDFHMFLESYIKYYSRYFNLEQLKSDTINLKKNLPLEILMSKIFIMIYKNL